MINHMISSRLRMLQKHAVINKQFAHPHRYTCTHTHTGPYTLGLALLLSDSCDLRWLLTSRATTGGRGRCSHLRPLAEHRQLVSLIASIIGGPPHGSCKHLLTSQGDEPGAHSGIVLVIDCVCVCVHVRVCEGMCGCGCVVTLSGWGVRS